MEQYLIIFTAMAIFVALNTIRVILVIRGKKGIAAVIAALENFIYMSAFAFAITSPDNTIIPILVASAGYAVGVLTGTLLEKKLNMGYLVVQIITEGDLQEIIDELRKDNYGLTNWKVSGLHGEKDMLYLLVKKTRYSLLEAKIKSMRPTAFVVMYEPKYFYGGFVSR